MKEGLKERRKEGGLKEESLNERRKEGSKEGSLNEGRNEKVESLKECTENTFGMQLKKLPFYIRRRNLFVFVPSPLPEKEGTKLLVAVAEAFYFFKR